MPRPRLRRVRKPTSSSPKAASSWRPAVGYAHTCAIVDNAVACWGDNMFGQVGNNTTANALTPVSIGLPATAVALGEGYSCAITSFGGAKCWGLGTLGQLGNGSTSESNQPSDVAGLAGNVTAIAAG